MAGKNVIRFGVMGMHGFSRTHINSILSAAQSGENVELTAVAAYRRELDEKYAAELESKGIKLVSSFEELIRMKGMLDFITLPVGIHLHSSMALAAVNEGFNVYLEKPAAGSIQEVDALIRARKKTSRKIFVGYQDCFQPSLRNLKRRFIAGEIGRLKKIVVAVAWPRPVSYYRRNTWAGRLFIDGKAVLDSPLNNACAHYMNLALFLAGRRTGSSATPVSVECEMYRVNDIESADTVSVRVKTEEGVEIVWTASHACTQGYGPLIKVEGETAVAAADRTTEGFRAPWFCTDAADSTVLFERARQYADPFVQVSRYMNGNRKTPVCTLEMARPHTLVVNGIHAAAPVIDIPASHRAAVTLENGDVLNTVPGMNEVIKSCYEKGCLLSESGCAPWSKPAYSTDVRNLTVFNRCDLKIGF